MGGLVGQVNGNVLIEKSYSDTKLKSNGTATGGIIGYFNGTMKLNSTLSLADLASGTPGFRVHGNGNANNSTNNYELAESGLRTNATTSTINGNRLKTIARSEISAGFFEKTLGFDTKVWNLEQVEKGHYPTLKNSDPADESNQEETVSPENPQLYIPEYERISKLEGFDKDKEMLYANLYRLMPYYDASCLVSDGSKISKEDVLNKKEIEKIIPYDKDGNLVTVLTDKEYDTVHSIKVVFDEETIEEYSLTDGEKRGAVANYTVKELNVGYNYPTYLLDSDNPVIGELTELAKSYGYTEDLDPLTSEADSRLYRDFYNETTKEQLKDFVVTLLANTQDYYLYMDNTVLNAKVKSDVEGNLKRLLCAYNYYNKWYSIEVKGIDLKDVVYFGLAYDNIDAKAMTNEILGTTATYRQTNNAHNFYSSRIAAYTGKANIGAFIDYFIGPIGGYKDVNDWFAENYQGPVYEVQAKGYEDSDIEYRAWRQIKRRSEYLLPLLTLPDNAAYVMSCPTQLMVGSLRVYTTKPEDASQREIIRGKMENMCKLYSQFYGTTAGFIPHDTLNAYTDVQVDTYNTYDDSGTKVRQYMGTTEEPFHKYFNDAGNWWGTRVEAVGAYALGDKVYWVAYQMLSDTAFNTWSHESGHNQDSKIFLLNAGRRLPSGAEDYADGNTSQSVGDGAYNFNLAYVNDNAADKANNLTPERIDSTEKLESYYKNMFDMLDFLDYVEAKAFLTLTPEQQAKIATQVFYPNSSSFEMDSNGDVTTGWRLVTAEQIEAMNLKTVEDLWENHIIIKPGQTGTTSKGGNSYGFGTNLTRRWYQPHNDYGRADSDSFKQLAWEMLGIGGYENGYITYYSRKSANDLEAIRKVTGDDTMTFKKYKAMRYERMEENWDSLSALFDTDELLEKYEEALALDSKNGDRSVNYATNLRTMTYHYVKRATDDFRSDIFEDNTKVVKHVGSAQELRSVISDNPMAMIELDNDIDFTDVPVSNTTAFIANVTFTGSLNGNGHSIKGLKQPLFKSVKFSRIYDLKIEGADIDRYTLDNIGALSQTMEKCTVENVHLADSSIRGRRYVGGLAGVLKTVNVSKCSVDVKIEAASGYVGGLAGSAHTYGTVTDCYSIGAIQASGDRTGGLIGYLDNERAKNCFSASAVTAGTNTYAGGLFGYTNNAIVKNSLSSATGTKAYLFDSQTAAAGYSKYENNYENGESNLTSTTKKSGIDFTGKISIASAEQMGSKAFYTDTLGWSEDVWKFDNVESGGLPTLKSDLDSNEITSTITKLEISSVEDLQKMGSNPNGSYVLTKDIDAGSITSNNTALVTAAFYGKLDGKGYTIRNLNTAIFANLSGQVTNLNIENANINKGSGAYANVLATRASGAYISNIKMDKITLAGNNYVAALIGIEDSGSGSVVEKVQITNAVVNGATVATGNNGCYNAVLIGRKKAGGSISDVLVQGKMTVKYTDNGPVVGEATNVTMKNIVSDVEVTRTADVRTNQNAGFTGFSRGSTSFTNCIALGSVSEDCYKFSAKLEANVTLNNCYEVQETTGLSNVKEGSSQTTIAAAAEEIKTEEFYKTTLRLSPDIWDFSTVATEGTPRLK